MEKNGQTPQAASRGMDRQKPAAAKTRPGMGGAARFDSAKMERENARLAILALWPEWANDNLAGRKPRDPDAHAFLRSIRKDHPELLTFKSGLAPYEAAFFWILGAGFVPY